MEPQEDSPKLEQDEGQDLDFTLDLDITDIMDLRVSHTKEQFEMDSGDISLLDQIDLEAKNIINQDSQEMQEEMDNVDPDQELESSLNKDLQNFQSKFETLGKSQDLGLRKGLKAKNFRSSRDGYYTSRDEMTTNSKSRSRISRRQLKSQKTNLFTKAARNRIRNESSHPVYFNVMLAGKIRTGKTQFLGRFLEDTFGKTNVVKQESSKIAEYIVEKRIGGRSYILKVIYVPGYGDHLPIGNWYSSVKQFTKNKQEEYEEMKRVRLLELGLGPRGMEDCRIHLCLYFLTGHRLQLNDVIYMKKLQKYVNLIPVISSIDDDVDEEEIEAYKSGISKEAKEYNLEFYNVEKDIKSVEEIEEELNIELIAPIPPFWFQSNFVEDMDEVVNSDFKFLSYLIIGDLSVSLVDKTENLWNVRKEQNIEKKEKEKMLKFERNYNLGVGVVLGLGVVGAFIAVKNTLF